MPYEIPQQLQYEEKIVFGLTFRQLVYALLLGLPAILIFMKSHLSIYLKVTLGAPLIGLACLFMFFNFSSYIRNMLSWFKFREISINHQKMFQFLGIEKIKDGCVYVSKTKKSH